MMEIIGFGVIASVMVLSAIKSVTSTNLVHTVLWLAASLLVTSVLYVTLYAPFFAAIQVILYTGGLVTLMIFGIMLTRRADGVEVKVKSVNRIKGAGLSLGVFGLLATAILRTPNLPDAPPRVVGARELGKLFLTEHLLAFEVLSILLLAVMVGAIIIVCPRSRSRQRIMPARPRPLPQEGPQ